MYGQMCERICRRASPQGLRETMRDGGVPGAAGHGERRSGWGPRSPANPELLGHGAIAIRILLAQVFQQPPALADEHEQAAPGVVILDRKSTRLNSSHLGISYAVF